MRTLRAVGMTEAWFVKFQREAKAPRGHLSYESVVSGPAGAYASAVINKRPEPLERNPRFAGIMDAVSWDRRISCD